MDRFILLLAFLTILSHTVEVLCDDDDSSEDLKFSSSLLDRMPSFPTSQEDYDTDIVRSNDLFSFASSNDGKPLYQCYSCEQPDCDEETICEGAHQCWKSRVIDSTGNQLLSKGCTTSADQVILYCNTMFFDGKSRNFENSAYAIECCEGDLCNNGTFPVLPAPVEPDEDDDGDDSYMIIQMICYGILPAALMILLGSISFLVMKKRHERKMARMNVITGYQDSDLAYRDDLHATAAGDSTLREVFEHSVTSGSGSGAPLLIQRTLAKQITLGECIGKGRYGEVWRGIWHGESVAVKIFFSRDEASWTRETEIYSTVLFRHESILGYIGSDMTSRNSITQLWLVTHYHPLGSLYDFLNLHVLSHSELLRLSVSAINGLLHLHTEIFGTQGKPAIAHRDIKSKNILVQSNGTCVIADFGLAVTHTQTTGEMNVAQNPRVGTKRYMSPEVLDQTINMNVFESFRRVDIYAFGLVLWEMCRRCVTSGISEEYRPPFFDVVPSDPSFEDMRKVVCVDQYRPQIPARWEEDSILNGIALLVRECWHQNPTVRLSALRLKKSLHKICQSDPKVLLDI